MRLLLCFVFAFCGLLLVPFTIHAETLDDYHIMNSRMDRDTGYFRYYYYSHFDIDTVYSARLEINMTDDEYDPMSQSFDSSGFFGEYDDVITTPYNGTIYEKRRHVKEYFFNYSSEYEKEGIQVGFLNTGTDYYHIASGAVETGPIVEQALMIEYIVPPMQYDEQNDIYFSESNVDMYVSYDYRTDWRGDFSFVHDLTQEEIDAANSRQMLMFSVEGDYGDAIFQSFRLTIETTPPIATPEPSSFMLLAIGLVAGGWWFRHHRRSIVQ